MVALVFCSSHVSVKNIKSSLEVKIKSLTKNDLLLRDLTLSRPMLIVLLIGFKVDFGLEGIGEIMRDDSASGMQKLPCFEVGNLGFSRLCETSLILCLRLNTFLSQ